YGYATMTTPPMSGPAPQSFITRWLGPGAADFAAETTIRSTIGNLGNSQSQPFVASDGSTQFLVLWWDDGAPAHPAGVYYRLLDLDGAPLGPAARLDLPVADKSVYQWTWSASWINGKFQIVFAGTGWYVDSLGSVMPQSSVSTFALGSEHTAPKRLLSTGPGL